MTIPPPNPVRRRRVFYIPGYDPVHPRRYRELYRKEGAEQARISGYDLTVRARSGAARYGWHATARMDGAEVAAEIDVLVWSDIVKVSMDQGIAGTYLQLARTLWTYVASGALFRLMTLRKGPILAALYPVAMLTAELGVAVLAGVLLAQIVGLILPAPVAGWAGLALGLGAGVAVLRWFKRQDHRLFAYYLMHDFAFSAQGGGANPSALEARMAEFRAAIRAALAEGWDEVLVVGHSSGAHIGVSVLADLCREGRPPGVLSFLTLGQVVPMVSFLPRATRLRADLHDLSLRPDITWIDVTAPGDGCAFALCDPVAVSGVAPRGKLWPLVLSAAFSQTLSPEKLAGLRRRYFRLHFQYLCAFDRPGDYDYFRITAGPLTLGARFAGRAPSKSRIDVAVSGHTSRAA